MTVNDCELRKTMVYRRQGGKKEVYRGNGKTTVLVRCFGRCVFRRKRRKRRKRKKRRQRKKKRKKRKKETRRRQRGGGRRHSKSLLHSPH